MSASRGNRFDGWYEQMAGDELRHALVAECLGLSPHLKVTGLLGAAGLAEVIEALALPEGGTLVDLGCGRGGYGREIARSCGSDLIGIDSSAVAISQAELDRQLDRSSGDVRFQLASFESTGLPEHVADAVVCIDSYQFASSPEALFSEAFRISRPGGRLVVTGAMRRALLEQADEPSPVEQALIDSGWTNVRVQARPEWLATERDLWTRVINEPSSTPALDVLRAEAAELLPVLPHIQRFLASAVR